MRTAVIVKTDFLVGFIVFPVFAKAIAQGVPVGCENFREKCCLCGTRICVGGVALTVGFFLSLQLQESEMKAKRDVLRGGFCGARGG